MLNKGRRLALALSIYLVLARSLSIDRHDSMPSISVQFRALWILHAGWWVWWWGSLAPQLDWTAVLWTVGYVATTVMEGKHVPCPNCNLWPAHQVQSVDCCLRSMPMLQHYSYGVSELLLGLCSNCIIASAARSKRELLAFSSKACPYSLGLALILSY